MTIVGFSSANRASGYCQYTDREVTKEVNVLQGSVGYQPTDGVLANTLSESDKSIACSLQDVNSNREHIISSRQSVVDLYLHWQPSVSRDAA